MTEKQIEIHRQVRDRKRRKETLDKYMHAFERKLDHDEFCGKIRGNTEELLKETFNALEKTGCTLRVTNSKSIKQCSTCFFCAIEGECPYCLSGGVDTEDLLTHTDDFTESVCDMWTFNMNIRSCVQCHYVRRELLNSGEILLECRINPPTDRHEDVAGLSIYPIVSVKTGWCGKFELASYLKQEE